MFSRRRDQVQEQMVFSKCQVLTALQKAAAEGQVDYHTTIFVRYLLDKWKAVDGRAGEIHRISCPCDEGAGHRAENNSN